MLLLAAATLAAGCGSGKSAASGPQRYVREPIKETTEEQLKTDALMIGAKMDAELGRDDRALARYREIVSRDANYSAAYFEISQLMANKGMTDSAVWYGKKALEKDGNNVWYKLSLATLYKHAGQLKECNKMWETIVSENPEVLEYYYELSNAYLQSGDLEKAVSALNRVEKLIGVTEEISLQKAKLWNAIGKKEKAEKELEALADAMPNESKYNAMLAENAMQAGDYDKAKRYYDRVLAADPDDEYIHFSLAQYYHQTHQPRKAFKELREAYSRESSLTTANKIRILSSFYPSEGLTGSAAEEMDELLALILKDNDDSVGYSGFYGEVLMHQRRFAEAAHQLELWLTRDSSAYRPWEMLLVCESEVPELEEKMLGHARRAQNLFPLHPLPYYLQGLYAFRHGEYGQALEQLEQCETMGFSNGYLEVETYQLMAECHHALGHAEEARKYINKAVKLSKNPSKELLDRYREIGN